MIKSKIDDYTLSIRERTMKIVVHRNNEEVKVIPTKSFVNKGMMLLPKKLYDKINSDLKYANIYDKFLKRFWDWYEEE